eukprot:gene12629-3335_t
MDGLFLLMLVVGLSTDLVEGYAYSIRIDEHERACFGHDLKEGSGEVYVDLQVVLYANESEELPVVVCLARCFVGGAYQICLDNTFTSEYKVVTLVLENDLPDEMQMLLGKIATNDPNLPQGFKVSESPAN